MSNSNKDIDSILQSIKQKKAQREKDSFVVSSAEKINEQSIPISKATITKEDTDSTLSDFLNATPEVKQATTPKVENTQIPSTDDKFAEFFSKTVTVTKTPEELKIENQKRSSKFFQKKHFTDSLSLNVPDEEFFEKEVPKKKGIFKNLFSNSEDKQKEDLPLFTKYKEDLQNSTDSPIIKKETSQKPKQESTKEINVEKKAVLTDEDLSFLKGFETLSDEVNLLSEEALDAQNTADIDFSFDEGLNEENQSLAADIIENKKTNDLIKTNTATVFESIAFSKEEIENTSLKNADENIEKIDHTDEILKEKEENEEYSSFTFDDILNADEDNTALEDTQNSLLSENLIADDEPSFEKEDDILLENDSENTGEEITENTDESIEENIATINEDEEDLDLTTYINTSPIETQGELNDTTKIAVNEDFNSLHDTLIDEDTPFIEYESAGEIFKDTFDESADISLELQSFKTTLNLRVILGLVGSAILTLLSLATTNVISLPSLISPLTSPTLYYLANLIVYLLILVAFIPTILTGAKGFFSSPTPDSFLTAACILSVLQLVVLVIFSNSTNPETITIFAGFVCLALALNAYGKKITTNNIIRNLKLAYAPEGINVGYILQDTDAVKRLARSLDSNMPNILLSRKTSNISNFLQAGFSISSSDYLAQKLSRFSVFITILSFALGFFISKDFVIGLSCSAGAAILQIPLSHTMIVSVPQSLMQKKLKPVGALVNGWQGIDQLSKTTHVTFDAKHLFPENSVKLHGIKAYENERLDLAILYAASVLIEHCDTLRSVFMQVINNKTDILYDIESCEYTQNQGYVAWIENSRILIGNASLMEKYDIKVPVINSSNALSNKNRKPIFLAVNGKLFGVFVVSYHQSKAVKENLDVFIKHSRNIILTSMDFNLDSSLIENIYSLPKDSVNVLNQQEYLLMKNFTDYTFTTTACVAHLDNLQSLTQSFSAAESARVAQTICTIVQTLSVALGGILALVFSYSLTIASLPITAIIPLSFGLAGLCLATAYAKKY